MNLLQILTEASKQPSFKFKIPNKIKNKLNAVIALSKGEHAKTAKNIKGILIGKYPSLNDLQNSLKGLQKKVGVSKVDEAFSPKTKKTIAAALLALTAAVISIPKTLPKKEVTKIEKTITPSSILTSPGKTTRAKNAPRVPYVPRERLILAPDEPSRNRNQDVTSAIEKPTEADKDKIRQIMLSATVPIKVWTEIETALDGLLAVIFAENYDNSIDNIISFVNVLSRNEIYTNYTPTSDVARLGSNSLASYNPINNSIAIDFRTFERHKEKLDPHSEVKSSVYHELTHREQFRKLKKELPAKIYSQVYRAFQTASSRHISSPSGMKYEQTAHEMGAFFRAIEWTLKEYGKKSHQFTRHIKRIYDIPIIGKTLIKGMIKHYPSDNTVIKAIQEVLKGK